MYFNFKSLYSYTIILVSCFTLVSCGNDESTSSVDESSFNVDDSINASPLDNNAPSDSDVINLANGTSSTNSQEVYDPDSIDDESADIGDLSIESNLIENNNNQNWIEARGWTNLTVANRMQSVVAISFNVRAISNNINGVVAVTNGPADDYDGLALIFRMYTNGYMDVRDGDTYESDMELSYEVGEVYFIEMFADFNSRSYDVFVTYPSGQRFPARLSASFRSTQSISTANNLVIYEANEDAIEITNFRVDNNLVNLTVSDDNASSENNSNNEENDVNSNNNEGDGSMLITDIPPPIVELDSSLPRVEVSNSSELLSALTTTSAGGIIYVASGTYGCVDLNDRNHTREAPLLIEGVGDDVLFDGDCSYVFNIEGSSYIALRNISITGGRDGVKIRSSDHIIIDNIEVSQNGQAGIYIAANSSYVDVIDSEIHDTGAEHPQWGECIYIGTGDNTGFPDETTNVWIENNNIYNCGFGEGINVKPEVFNTTLRGNLVSNIMPGSLEYITKYNQAAITVEGGRGSNPSNNHRPTQIRNIWVENNNVSNITQGRWNNGIMIGGTGVYVISNNLSNIDENAIWVNGYGDLGLPVYVFGNTTNSSGRSLNVASGVDLIESYPSSANPNQAQNWLPR